MMKLLGTLAVGSVVVSIPFTGFATSLNSRECQEFKLFSTREIDLPVKDIDQLKITDPKFNPSNPLLQATRGFNTDGLVVMKDGKVVYEFYDGDPAYGGHANGLYTRDTPHSLWSASKTITATLMGRAMFEKAKTLSGQVLSPETRLQEFIPIPNVANIQIENLLNMSAGLKWDENYESKVRNSTFLPMLYLKAQHADMVRYAASQPMDAKPGTQWNYSGGNSILLLSILSQLYAEHFPWELLFNPLHMKNAVFERDPKNIFVGNSYVYLRPLDMAAIGQLYLDQGRFEGRSLLDPTWVRDAQELSPAVQSPLTSMQYIHEEGVYGRRAFWLNQRVVQKGKAPYERQFPNSPTDMYFAAGHYGQLILVLPSQHIVIARTGHDKEYWDRIDHFVKVTLACFAEHPHAH